jgi:Domain of unknown function (DUF4783)
MKNLIFFLLITLTSTLSASNGGPGNPSVLEAISNALSLGDADALSKHFADNIEISIQDNEQVLSKEKATEMVRGFFSTNKPKAFSQVHKGTSRANSDQYCIGNLTASNGAFRVYIYLKTTPNSMTIQEMRFDKE